MNYRTFIETLQKTGEITTITKPISTEYEIASVVEAMGEKPVMFTNVKESAVAVVAGLVSSKDLIARAIGTTKDKLLPKLSAAIENPVAPKMAENAPCKEVVEPSVDLTKLPIMGYTEKDGGK